MTAPRYRHQQQPTLTTCGQTVLAILVGVPVAEVVAELGGRPTKASELAEFLRRRGWDVPTDRLRRCSADQVLAWQDRGEPTILRVHWVESCSARPRSHWVLRADSRVYDPLFAATGPSVGAFFEWLEVVRARITSYMSVRPPCPTT